MSFQVSQNFELVSHEKGKAYPIPVKEWEHLKQQIQRIEERANLWHTIGSILLGAAGSAFLNGYTATFPAPPTGSKWSVPEVINWAYFATTVISGVLAFCFGRSHKKLQKQLAQDVVKQMELIESRFQKETGLQQADAPTPVCYGATIRLEHTVTRKFLFSEAKNYTHPNSSGQQIISAVEEALSGVAWIVKGPHGQPDNFQEGQPVKRGDTIRLEHVTTRKNLHSHGNAVSPISGQQEVTGAGANGLCDTNDNWRVEIEGGAEWISKQRIKLIHVNTNKTLHSHNNAKPEFLDGNQEVTCYGGRDNNDWWLAAE